MGSNALWQVEEIERDRVRNSEFGLRSQEIPHSAFMTPHWNGGAVAQLVER